MDGRAARHRVRPEAPARARRLPPHRLRLRAAHLGDDLEPATPEAVKKACKFVLRARDCESPANIFTPSTS